MVTVLAGVIAVLGTSILFLSGDSLNSFFGEVGKSLGNNGNSSENESLPTSQAQPTAPVENKVEEQPVELVEQVEIDCDAMNISGEHPVPHTGEDCFRIFNEHVWVNKLIGRINERSTTAFVVENTGSKDITISSIRVKDVAVLQGHWFFTTDPTIVNPANVQKDLPADYTEGIVPIAGGFVVMQSGSTTLKPGQTAIVYLNEAGGLTERDAGTIVTLQVQAGNMQIEKVVPAVRA